MIGLICMAVRNPFAHAISSNYVADVHLIANKFRLTILICHAAREVLQFDIIFGCLLITLYVIPVGLAVGHQRAWLQVAFIVAVFDAWILFKVHEVDTGMNVGSILTAD